MFFLLQLIPIVDTVAIVMNTMQLNNFNLPTSTVGAWLPSGTTDVMAISNAIPSAWNAYHCNSISINRQIEIRNSKHIALNLKSKA